MSKRTRRSWRMTMNAVPGPWISLGIHVDLQAPCVDLHIGWWILTVGRPYAMENE